MDPERVRTINRIMLPVVFIAQLVVVVTTAHTLVRVVFGFGALVSLAAFVVVLRGT